MKIGRCSVVLAAAALLASWPAAARAPQSASAAPSQLYHLAVLSRGSAWTPARTSATDSIQTGHLANISRMFDAGDLLAAGPFGDEGPLRGIFVLRTDTTGWVPPALQDDPAIRSGRLRADLFRWYGPAGLSRDYRERLARDGVKRDSMVTFAFVMLRRGPRWTANATPAVSRVLKAHQQNIETLRRKGTVIAAGPIDGTGELRGVLVFDADAATTRRLLEKDPAVRAGRFVFDIHPWWTAYGIIPGH